MKKKQIIVALLGMGFAIGAVWVAGFNFDERGPFALLAYVWTAVFGIVPALIAGIDNDDGNFS